MRTEKAPLLVLVHPIHNATAEHAPVLQILFVPNEIRLVVDSSPTYVVSILSTLAISTYHVLALVLRRACV